MSSVQHDPGDLVRVLDEEGGVVEGSSVPALSDREFVDMLRWMRLTRRFDERAVSLQRQGRLGTFPPAAGQEAAQVGSALALDDDDWAFPSYREHGVCLVRGYPLKQMLLYWMGDERGNSVPDGVNVFPLAIPIATQIPHATGAAWSTKLLGKDRVCVTYFGDGATSEGDFHEGVNFGGVFDVPCVYVCNNNQWAISTPAERQTASATIAGKAAAYGIPGVRVDGMDPLAVYQVTEEAVTRARDPRGDERRPTLIEAVQYRFGAHTTADDPTAYRSADEVERWRQRDPIPRFEAFLRDRALLDDETLDALDAEIGETVDEAVEVAEAKARPHPDDIFEHVFADPPAYLADQRDTLRTLRERRGDDDLLE